MATCSVRIEFWCKEATEKLKYTHSFPKHLVADATISKNDDAYTSSFFLALQPITAAHGLACFRVSSQVCDHCGSTASGILHTPISWLHKPEDPYIALWVSAICAQDGCTEQTQERVQDMISEHITAGCSIGSKTLGL